MLPRRHQERTDVMDHITSNSQLSNAIIMYRHMYTHVRSCNSVRLWHLTFGYMLKFPSMRVLLHQRGL